MTLKELYEIIKGNLADAGIKKVMMYNANIGDKPMPYPFAMVNFSQLVYQSTNKRQLQVDDCRIALHLFYKQLDEEGLEFFNMRDAVVINMIDCGFDVTSENAGESTAPVMEWIVELSLSGYAEIVGGTSQTNKALIKPTPEIYIENE